MRGKTQTSAALLWSGISWNGYTRRLLHYAVTYSLDILFGIPFVALTVILAQPMTQAKCATIPETATNFTISAPANAEFGKVSLPGNSRVACQKLFAVWILLMVVAFMFILSAASAQIIHLREKSARGSRDDWLKDYTTGDPTNAPGSDFFTQKPVPGREYRKSSAAASARQWDSFGDRYGDEKLPRSPHYNPMGSFSRGKAEDDGVSVSNWSGSPTPSSPVLREYRPRRAEYAAGARSPLNQPTEARLHHHQGSRNYRRSSSIAMIGSEANARPRSRQRGFIDPRTGTPGGLRPNHPSAS